MKAVLCAFPQTFWTPSNVREVLNSLAIPKPRSEVITARNKSSSRGGVGDTANVIVVTWREKKRQRR